MTTSDIISLSALIVAVVGQIRSELKSKKIDSEQKTIKTEQDKLRKLLINKETKEAINNMKAEFSVRIMEVSKNNYKLKIVNKGKAQARNINITFPDGDGHDLLIMNEVNEKFPCNELYPQDEIDVIAIINLGSKLKYKIKLTWEDNYKKNNEKEFIIII